MFQRIDGSTNVGGVVLVEFAQSDLVNALGLFDIVLLFKTLVVLGQRSHEFRVAKVAAQVLSLKWMVTDTSILVEVEVKEVLLAVEKLA